MAPVKEEGLFITSSHVPEVTRASLVALPYELLAEICANFCWYLHAEEDDDSEDTVTRVREAQCTLARLSRTCRRMSEIVQPMLFHRVYASRASDLYLLARALVDRPELGSELTEVIVTTPHQDREMAHSQQIAGLVEENLSIGDVWTPAWSRFTAGDRFAALASLLLHFAPKLTSACFHLLGPPSLVIEQALKRWNTSIQHLTGLKRLTLRAFDHDHQFVLDQVVYLLRAVPSVEVLHCDGCADVSEQFRGLSGRAPIPNPPRLPNVTELILTDCGVARRGLANLTHALGDNLARVTVRKDGRHHHRHHRHPYNYNHGRSGWASSATGFGVGGSGGINGGSINASSTAPPEFTIASLELEEILEALQPRWAGTLRELTYHVPCALRLFPPPALESLPRFTALELLDLSTDAVDFGELHHTPSVFASWLPPSLRRLRLLGPALLVPSLRGLLDAVLARRLPNLERIDITDQVCAAAWLMDEVGKFRETVAGLRAQGVQVVIHPRYPELESKY
ncbi:hypothetical protein VTH82DRAFT_6529 [Thermothelomyces myriococcoides]